MDPYAAPRPVAPGTQVWVPKRALTHSPGDDADSCRNAVLCTVCGHDADGQLVIVTPLDRAGAYTVYSKHATPVGGLPGPMAAAGAALQQREMRVAAGRAVDAMLCDVAGRVRGFGEQMARVVLSGGDSKLLRGAVFSMMQDGQVGPAFAELAEDCLARQVLLDWERHRPQTGCRPEERDKRLEAQAALQHAARAWLTETGLARCMAGVTLALAGGGESPWLTF